MNKAKVLELHRKNSYYSSQSQDENEADQDGGLFQSDRQPIYTNTRNSQDEQIYQGT